MLWIRQDEENQHAEYRKYAADEAFHDMHRSTRVIDLPHRAVPVQIEKDAESYVWTIITPSYATLAYRLSTRSPVTSFTAFVDTLQPWEQELLQYAEFTNEPFEFCTDLQPHLRAVSDGSVRKETQGAFGWSMRNEHNITVASGMGPARGGGTMTSYRAEAYGMLAILRFLIRMAEFTEMTFPWTGVIGTDSQSLLDTLFGKDETRLKRDRDEPVNMEGAQVVLNCTCPDWDILIEIQESLSQHVKGHQDRERAYHTLDQMAQLNVDADARAGQYQDNNGATRPIALMTTRTKVHLLGNQGTVTSHYDKYLWTAATTLPLQTHLMDKYSWSRRILETINWDAHRRAIKRMYKRKPHLTKMVFDILPTTSMLNKYDNGRRTCPSCQCLHED